MHELVCVKCLVDHISYTHKHTGVMEAKWAGTRFTPFLVIDAEDDVRPLGRDDEEYINKVSECVDMLVDMDAQTWCGEHIHAHEYTNTRTRRMYTHQ
jgi:hypothetical protein